MSSPGSTLRTLEENGPLPVHRVRRRPIALEEGDEIAVLRQDNGPSVSSRHEDGAIGGLAKAPVPHGGRADASLRDQPRGQGRAP